jgi:outer membrane protein TolC
VRNMRPHHLALVFILAAGSLGAGGGGDDAGAVAGGGDAPYVLPELLSAPPTLPPDHAGARVLRLDLAEAMRIALEQNIGISVERQRMKSSRLGERLARAGMYEPILSLNYSRTGDDQPPPAIQSGQPGSGITSSSDSLQASISQRLPTGGQLSLGFNSSRTGSSTGAAAEPPAYRSTLTWSLVQPLLRGFSRDLVIPRYSILTAKIASEQERHQLSITAANLVQQTESAYWDVVLALYSYDVTVKSQRLAEDMVALTRRQIAAGVVPKTDLTGAENTLAQRRVAVLGAAASIEQAWDALRTTLNLPRDQWDRPILPIDHPQFAPRVVTSAEAALETALAHRPEIAQSALDLQASALALRKAKNDALPQIDLGLTGSVYGQDASYGGSLRDLGGHQTRGWGVSLNLTWTPTRRASKTSTELARIHHQVQAANREQRVQGIWNEVRSAVRTQRTAALQVTAASQARKLANESLEIENRKYLEGSSSNLAIATLQNGLASAELSELSALLSHERAATALLLATGQLLEHRRIKLQVAARP